MKEPSKQWWLKLTSDLDLGTGTTLRLIQDKDYWVRKAIIYTYNKKRAANKP